MRKAQVQHLVKIDCTSISEHEQRDLERIESRIAAGLSAFFDVAYALAEIKHRQLYRAEFTSFEEYCRKRWDMERAHAYRLIGAAEVCSKLSPIGDIPLPENECQVRPLAGLPEKVAKEAWRRAYEKAGTNGKITGALVEKTVKEVLRGQVKMKKVFLKEDWQIRITPLLEEALRLTRRGKKDGISEIVERVSLLLLVGRRQVPEE